MTQIIRNSKTLHFSKLLENSKSNIKNTWMTVKKGNLTATKPNYFVINYVTTTYPMSKTAKEFNTHVIPGLASENAETNDKAVESKDMSEEPFS